MRFLKLGPATVGRSFRPGRRPLWVGVPNALAARIWAAPRSIAYYGSSWAAQHEERQLAVLSILARACLSVCGCHDGERGPDGCQRFLSAGGRTGRLVVLFDVRPSYPP